MQEINGQDKDGDPQRDKYNEVKQVTSQKSPPIRNRLRVCQFLIFFDNLTGPGSRDLFHHKTIKTFSRSHQIRCCKCSQDRNGNDNGVDIAFSQPVSNSCSRHDKSELPDLRHTESRLDGYLHGFSGKPGSDGGKNDFTDQNQERYVYYALVVFHDDGRIHHHPYRNEENSAEKIFYRFSDPFYIFQGNRFGKNRTHDESAQSRR